jgi:hypothetical protein
MLSDNQPPPSEAGERENPNASGGGRGFATPLSRLDWPPVPLARPCGTETKGHCSTSSLFNLISLPYLIDIPRTFQSTPVPPVSAGRGRRGAGGGLASII